MACVPTRVGCFLYLLHPEPAETRISFTCYSIPSLFLLISIRMPALTANFVTLCSCIVHFSRLLPGRNFGLFVTQCQMNSAEFQWTVDVALEHDVHHKSVFRAKLQNSFGDAYIKDDNVARPDFVISECIHEASLNEVRMSHTLSTEENDLTVAHSPCAASFSYTRIMKTVIKKANKRKITS